MTAISFVNENRLNPVDVIVLRKKVFGMVNHYAIYLGKDFFGKPEFVANFLDGVQVIPEEKIEEQLKTYIPERIEKFQGTLTERNLALQRAKSKIGERLYSYLGNNCEHFKNWVHFGEKYSGQVNTAGSFLAIGGGAALLYAILNDKSKTAQWGAALLILGLILKGLADRTDKSNYSDFK